MNYVGPWKALSTRIKGMITAGATALERRDVVGSVAVVREQSRQILDALREFCAIYGKSLPPNATACIDRFIGQAGPIIADTESSLTQDMRREHLSGILTRYEALDGELAYHLSDMQPLIRARSDLAFVHLQRQIAVDHETRKKWQIAFGEDETRCEALGAVHLLMHGIWAFKATAAGAHSDLVYQEPVNLAEAERVAEGLVLTEWKKASSQGEADKKFIEARNQARRYVGGVGVFAGNELRDHRYAVVVTEREIKVPDDWVDPDSGVTYRHRNIAVNPRTPSKAKS